MRIAHVLRRLSFDDWGGTEQVVWNIAKAQSPRRRRRRGTKCGSSPLPRCGVD